MKLLLQFRDLYKSSASEPLLNIVKEMETIFRNNFDKLQFASFGQHLNNLCNETIDFSLIHGLHLQHSLQLVENIPKLFITMRVFYELKYRNREIQTVMLVLGLGLKESLRTTF